MTGANTAARDLFNHLSKELLGIIRGHLGDDLAAQVSFHKLSARTAATFENLGDDFWQDLCRRNGLGYLDENEDEDREHWENVAFECIEHAWACRHPGCGLSRLEENRTPLLSLPRAHPNRRPGSEMYRADRLFNWNLPFVITRDSELKHGLRSSTVFSHLAFRQKEGAYAEEKIFITYLRSPNHSARDTPPDDELEDHPIVSRSFAVFPPVDNVQLTGPHEFMRVGNTRGCTVNNIVEAIWSEYVHILL